MTPVRHEGYKFCQDICVPCYQTNDKTALRPSGFMDLAQEIAYWAAQELGFGYDSLHIHHVAWVLSRMHIRFVASPLWRDHVTLYTWHKGASGLFYLRDFDLKDQEGRTAIACTSSWVVINEETRHLVRPEELSHLMEVGEVDSAIAEPAPKIQFPKGAEAQLTGEHTVAFSDIDLIGHTNNVRYVVWAMDCLPYEDAVKPMKDLYINFNKETTHGETVQLYRLRTPDAWYIEGRSGGKSCFVVKMEY